MGSQQFCLKWNNHQSNMLAVFEQLLSNEALVDVTLACEGLSLKAHKMVLSACSPFFQALFVENPCKHPIVILKDMRYMDLKAIVEFMYRGEVNVSQDHLTALLKTAETLKVKGLAEVTNENKNGGLVTSVDGAADAKPVGTPRAESPPLSKRKRGRPRRRSPSDSNKSDSEDAPPATRIKGPDSPEIIEDGSMSSDRVTNLPAASPSSRTSNVASSSTAVPSGARHGSSVQASISQHTQDSIGDDVGEGDDADFDVEPLNVMEQSMTTENVPVFPDVASSSQALGDESQQSHHTGSTSDNSALVPVHPSLPSDISITSQVDIKPSPSSLIPYDDQTIPPVVAASPAAALSGDGASTAMAVMDASGVPAIAGPSSYQQSTPSHGLVTADPKLGVLSGENMSQQLHQSPLCDRSFTKKNCLEQHLPTQTDDRPSKCNRSASSFAQKVTLMDHPHTNTGGRSYKCDHYDSSFSQKGHMEEHLTTHTGERPYKCDQCGNSFALKNTLMAHLRTHTGERPYKCDHWGSSFANTGTLVRHFRTHTGERPYNCDHCGSSFARKGLLDRHVRTHTGERPYKCDHCNSSFAQKSSLVKHLRTHTGERPYNCDHCGNSFAEKGTLVIHLRTHTGERPFQCQLCPMAFKESTALAKHVRAHKSERPYQCQFCTMTFKRKYSLKCHENNKHASKISVP